jgi:hypothetical protein
LLDEEGGNRAASRGFFRFFVKKTTISELEGVEFVL